VAERLAGGARHLPAGRKKSCSPPRGRSKKTSRHGQKRMRSLSVGTSTTLWQKIAMGCRRPTCVGQAASPVLLRPVRRASVGDRWHKRPMPSGCSTATGPQPGGRLAVRIGEELPETSDSAPNVACALPAHSRWISAWQLAQLPGWPWVAMRARPRCTRRYHQWATLRGEFPPAPVVTANRRDAVADPWSPSRDRWTLAARADERSHPRGESTNAVCPCQRTWAPATEPVPFAKRGLPTLVRANCRAIPRQQRGGPRKKPQKQQQCRGAVAA